MYKALQNGWIPPEVVTEDEYARLKEVQDPENPLTAFAGFACSWGGKWFGGYARSNENRKDRAQGYARNARVALIKQMRFCADVVFECISYRLLIPSGKFVYCDPPYDDTTGYDAVEEFDPVAFWEQMRLWSKDNIVVVSEYSAPDDFECVAEFERTAHTARKKVIERLFKYRG